MSAPQHFPGLVPLLQYQKKVSRDCVSSVSFVCTSFSQLWLKMTTTTTMDLSDDQIDKLLAEAESRLAARSTGKSALAPHQSQAVLAIPDTATQVASGSAVTPVQDQTRQAKELAVRVPKPAIKDKKVRRLNALLRFPFLSRFRDDILSHISNEAGNGPVMGPMPAPK